MEPDDFLPGLLGLEHIYKLVAISIGELPEDLFDVANAQFIEAILR